MDIKQINNETKGFFEAVENETRAGLMTYSWAGTTQFIIDHTEVNSKFSGQGVGKKMVLAAVDFARKEGVKILPLCPFAKATFDKTPEIRDVLS